MDAVMFSLKRAFHKSVEAGLRLTKPFGLTPARFDLLYALHTRGDDAGARQCSLRAWLRVSAPTVSRMVTSLERLGLVVRRRDAKGRSCGVMLTDAGRLCIGRAIHALLERGAARRMVRAFWPLDRSRNTRAEWVKNQARVEELVDSLSRIRETLYDFAWLGLQYPTVIKSRARLMADALVA